MPYKNFLYSFSAEKNQQLIQERRISFEEIIVAIETDQLLDIIEHPNKEKYSHQKVYVVEMNEYIYLVPYVRKEDHTVFLKTIFPSRKLTKLYLGQRKGLPDEEK